MVSQVIAKVLLGVCYGTQVVARVLLRGCYGSPALLFCFYAVLLFSSFVLSSSSFFSSHLLLFPFSYCLVPSVLFFFISTAILSSPPLSFYSQRFFSLSSSHPSVPFISQIGDSLLSLFSLFSSISSTADL